MIENVELTRVTYFFQCIYKLIKENNIFSKNSIF